MRLTGRDLECVRSGRTVFSGLDFAADGGEALAVTGINGAGKSSLLRMIAGLLPVAGGKITFEGTGADLILSEQAHYLGHRDTLKPALTVLENLDFWRGFLGGETADGTASLEKVGLGHAAHLPAGFLSAGQRRRLSIARLLVVRRPVWLLDEPTSALDVKGQAMADDAIADHLRGGGMISPRHMLAPLATRQLNDRRSAG